MRFNNYQTHRPYIAVNTGVAKKPVRKLAPMNREDVERFRAEFHKARLLLSKGYMMVSLGNEMFEEAQDIFANAGLTFSDHMRHIFRDINESFEAIVREMNSIMDKKAHDDFSHDYTVAHDELYDMVSKFLDDIKKPE